MLSVRAQHSALLCSGAILVIVVAIAYANALAGSFQFDDYNVIVDNPAVHSWSAWWHSMPGIRPLLKLSYTVNWIAQPTAAGFVIFNLVCHALNTLLVFTLYRRWLTAAPSNYFRTLPQQHALALIAALIFALHPAQTEAVTYICGRSVALMSLFYLASLVAAGSAARRAQQYWSPLLFAAALLTKETAWTLPLALLLIDALGGESFIGALRRRWPHWLTLVAVGSGMLAIGGYRQLLGHSIGLRGPLANLALQVDGIFYLATQPLLMLQTNIDPDLRTGGALDGLWSIKLAILLALLACGIRWRKHWCGIAVLWFAVHLLPTNSFMPRNDIANDRQLYLALIGPALLAGRALLWLPGRATWLGVALIVFCLGSATLLRNADYRDEISLWQATARVSPYKPRVWNNLGYAYQLAGRVAEARAAYRYALALDPDNNRARINYLLLEDASAPVRE